MDELFENIFVLVPVALILFARVFAAVVKKKADARGTTRAAPASKDELLASLFGQPSARGHWEESPARQVPRPQERKAPETQPRRYDITPAPVYTETQPSEPELQVAQPLHAAARPAKATGSPGIKKLDRLPALKRAVAMAELLGPPKSLPAGANDRSF